MRIAGPQPFDRFRQRVRQHRRTDVLDTVAALAASMDEPAGPMRLPNVVQPFALSAIARAALLYSNDHRDQPVVATVTTLEPFHLVNTLIHRGLLDEPMCRPWSRPRTSSKGSSPPSTTAPIGARGCSARSTDRTRIRRPSRPELHRR